MGEAAENLDADLDGLVSEVMGDFPAFCSLLSIHTKSDGDKPFHFEDWHAEQKRFERERTGRDIVLKPRQVGFSTLELARDLWFAVVNRGVNVLVIAHDGDLAEQLFQTLHFFAKALREIGLLPRTKYSNKRELVFADTGSAVRIVEAGETEAAAKKKGRSGTVHRLHATEVAFWGAASETFGAVIQSVPGDGEVVVESTANGASGTFYDDVMAARAGRTQYRLHFFPWYDHAEYRAALPAGFDPEPRDEHERKLRAAGCDSEQIAWWRLRVDDPKVGLDKTLQEYPIDVDTCFRASGRQWIEPAFIDAMARHIREPLRLMPLVWKGQSLGLARIFAEPERGRSYVLFGDVAEGVAGDGSAITVLESRSGEQAAAFWSDTISPGDFGAAMCVLGWYFNTAQVAPERNNHGHAAVERIVSVMRYPHVFCHDDGRHGWNTTSATRPVLWDDMATAIRDGAVKIRDAETLAECRTIIHDDDGKPRARGKRSKTRDACKDDRFVSLAGAWQLRSMKPWSANTFTVKGL